MQASLVLMIKKGTILKLGINFPLLFCGLVLSVSQVFANDVDESESTPVSETKCPTSFDSKIKKYFEICDAESKHEGGVYLLQAKVYYGLSQAAQDALKSGVPITLQLKTEILRQRNYLWDETIATLKQKYRLQYHYLSEQYILTNLNTNVKASYDTSESAISEISEIEDLPIIDSNLLNSAETYYGRIRVKLVVGDLPSPLRLWAYMSSEWRLKSKWFQWQL